MRPAISSRQIFNSRGPKTLVDAERAPLVVTEMEPGAGGVLAPASTVFLIGRECPFRCLMCDLWKQTTDEPTPPGSLARQLSLVLPQIEHRGTIKLYNASNFFDRLAVPEVDLIEIARLTSDFQTVVVENHPKLVGPVVFDFAARLSGHLQVAMGLETSDPVLLKWLNKQMTVADYDRACQQLSDGEVSIRTFILLPTPGVEPAAAVSHTLETVRHALKSGSEICSLIPLRGGNGLMDQWIADGVVTLPSLGVIEDVFRISLNINRTSNQRILLDLWDLQAYVRDEGELFDLRNRYLRAMQFQKLE